jgi:molecular chaperone GrpE
VNDTKHEAAGAADDERAQVEETDFPAADDAESRIADLEAELARAKDRWLRAEAEFKNAQRRAAREIEEAERRGQDRVLLPLLSLADDLERALAAAREAGEGESALAKGIELVEDRLVETLRAEGVIALDVEGKEFDPREHEAMLTAPHAHVPPGHVVQVIAKGWRRGEKLVRPARVLVSSGPSDSDPGR